MGADETESADTASGSLAIAAEGRCSGSAVVGVVCVRVGLVRIVCVSVRCMDGVLTSPPTLYYNHHTLNSSFVLSFVRCSLSQASPHTHALPPTPTGVGRAFFHIILDISRGLQYLHSKFEKRPRLNFIHKSLISNWLVFDSKAERGVSVCIFDTGK